jgi:glutaredoxin
MNIIVYYKTGCPWAVEVMDFLDDHNIPFDERNISADPEFQQECVDKSGQAKSPTLDIDGEILADADTDAVAEYLESRGVNV